MRRTGIVLVAALALSFAVLGVFLAVRCGAKCKDAPPAEQPETLTVRNDPRE